VSAGSEKVHEQETKPLVCSDLPTFRLESFPLPCTTLKTLGMLVKSNLGCSILVYGEAHETGKTSFAVSLAASAGKKAVFLERIESIGTDDIQQDMDRLQLRLNPADHVIVVDNDDGLLRSSSPFSNYLPRSWITAYLKGNKVPLVWTVDGDLGEIPLSVLRLFDFVVEFTQAIEKVFVWPPSVLSLWHRDLEKYAKLAHGELTRVLAAWEKTLDSSESLESQKSRLIDLLERRRKLSVIDVEPVIASVPPTLDTSLWNTDVPLKDIEDGVSAYLRWLPANRSAKEPYAVLCSGAPGSGKSLFLKHLASVHNLSLKVFRASDILRSLVGATEQQIAGVFKGAKPNEAILLEECDSLLYSRAKSTHKWESSAVNEFLAQLESYAGLVFCSTNFLGSLDEAVARRFVAKVSFFPLKDEQIPRAWAAYFPDLAMPEAAVHLLQGLCAGDFKTVAMKRRWSLDGADSAKIFQDLAREKEAKERFGVLSRKVGFQG